MTMMARRGVHVVALSLCLTGIRGYTFAMALDGPGPGTRRPPRGGAPRMPALGMYFVLLKY